MKEYLASKGFKFIGSCGCSTHMQRYQSPEAIYHTWEVWIDIPESKFQVRRFFNQNFTDSKIVAIAGRGNYQAIFEHHVGKQKIPS